MRQAPDLELKRIQGYAALICHGWDTIVESFDLSFSDTVASQLEQAKQVAMDDQSPVSIQFGGEHFQILPAAPRCRWVLANDDFQIRIRSLKMDYPISVEYTNAGLWEHGHAALKDRVLRCLFKEGSKPRTAETDLADLKTWQRISIAHFAFDFYSPDFAQEMVPELWYKVLCPSKVKKRYPGKVEIDAWGSVNFETFTIGGKANLQVQIYDKGKEVIDKPHKSWMLKVWEQEGYHVDRVTAKTVYRLEIRFGKEFLRNRGILIYEELEEKLSELLSEALLTRRLVEPNSKDQDRRRWPLHPLWSEAYIAAGEAKVYAPIGKQSTLSAQAKFDMMKKSMAGTARAATILKVGDYDALSATNFAYESLSEMESDKGHEKKVGIVKERYLFEGDAR